MKTNFSFESERLITAPLKKSDITSIYRIYSDKDAMKYRGSRAMETIEDAYKMVTNEFYEDNLTSNIRVGIRKKLNNCLLGTLLLKINHNSCKCEIGFSFGKEYWGNGFASETLAMVEKELVNSKNIKELNAWCVKENVTSVKVFEKAEFIKTVQNKYPQSILFRKKLNAPQHGV